MKLLRHKLVFVCLLILLFCGSLSAQEDYPFVGVVTQDKINVRAGANINFEVLSKLVNQEKVTVVGKSYNWYKISLPPDARCYINERYVKIEDTEGVVSANRVNIRSNPGDNFSILGQVNKDTRVKILKKSGEWYGIEPPENCFGWVHEKFIKYYSEFKEEDKEEKELSEVSVNKDLTSQDSKVPLPIVKETPGPAKEAPVNNFISSLGVIQPMGRVLNRAGTHKLTSDGKIIYLLQGDKNKLNNFINYRVKITGEKKILSSSRYPVIVVKEIIPSE